MNHAVIMLWLPSVAFVSVGAIVVFWSLIGRRIAHDGRRRCPRCRYDMTGASGLRCPECGRQARNETALRRPKRRWGVALLGLIVLVTGAGMPVAVSPFASQVLKYAPDRVLVNL